MRSCDLVAASLRACRRNLWIAAVALTGIGWGQSQALRDPHIGYVYPAGVRRGTVVEVAVGGQAIQSTSDVIVSGKGVTASVVHSFKPVKSLKGDERKELMRRIGARRAELLGKQAEPVAPPAGEKDAELPEIPSLWRLDSLGLDEIDSAMYELTSGRNKKQQNTQIAETVLLAVTVDPNAAPGERELRLVTREGLTNPMRFEVGDLPEYREMEPNDPGITPKAEDEAPVRLPAVLNGRILPGDADRFRIEAKKGQKLVMEVEARSLIPYLADAVPGWFQATLTVLDDHGNQLAFDDDFRFNPDPVVFFAVPADGVYEVEIRDALYRGREDFVYRLTIGELPFVTAIHPLGATAGKAASAWVTGWNLPASMVALDTHPGPLSIRQTTLKGAGRGSNPIPYSVDSAPECFETEPEAGTQPPQKVTLPIIVNGFIDWPGDVDSFQFVGKAGDEVVADVCARRVNSTLDSLVRLLDSDGRTVAWNDDNDDQNDGLLTHKADSYLLVKLPKDGVYTVTVADSQGKGDKSHGYRLRLAAPQPDFALRVTPSSLNIPAGRAVPVTVHALRRDGFQGEIAIRPVDAPPGFEVAGARIPAGQNVVRMTLTAPPKPTKVPVTLRFEGHGTIAGRDVVRPAVPAEDMMQAFLYRHLVPSQELLVSVRGAKGRSGSVQLANTGPLKLTAGQTASVTLRTPRMAPDAKLRFALNDPPKGLTLTNVDFGKSTMTLRLKADDGLSTTTIAGNLIVDVTTEVTPKPQKEKPKNTEKRRISLGVLPAIPFEIRPKSGSKVATP